MPFVQAHDLSLNPADGDILFAVRGDSTLLVTAQGGALPLPAWPQGAQFCDPGQPLLLGDVDGRRCWLACCTDDAGAPDGCAWTPGRSLMAMLEPGMVHAACCALSLRWWLLRNRHCGSCGTATVPERSERALRCPACGAVAYPTASAAVIVAVTKGERLLLAGNKNFRPGMQSLIAGFVDPGENLEQAVARELREEVGIEVCDIRYAFSQSWPFPNSLMVGFTARHAAGELRVDGHELHTAGWFARDALPEVLPSPGSIAHALIERWRNGNLMTGS